MSMLTGSEDFFEVPEEESVAEIRDRYLDIHSHAVSYNWKALKTSSITSEITLEEVNMNLTLEESSIVDGMSNNPAMPIQATLHVLKTQSSATTLFYMNHQIIVRSSHQDRQSNGEYANDSPICLHTKGVDVTSSLQTCVVFQV